MKRYILLLFAIILSIPLLAQLEVKEGSFKEVPGFININTENMYDDNDKPYAVLKIKTENISSKERHELNFKGDAQTFFEVEYKDGEVWLYISYYATYIKISHEEFSSTEFHFPFDMKPKCGYELTLVNKTAPISNGWASLTITTSPENGAEIKLNGRDLNQTTPYTNNMIPAGKYEISVSKYGFKDATKTIVINDGTTSNIDIDMPYLYVSVNIESEPSESIVYIDDVKCGITPLTLTNMKYGTHEIRIENSKYKTYKEHIVVNDNNLLDLHIVLEKCPNGAINSIFSVSETKKVYFSQGNLQYQASTKTWRFAENQWDFVGNNKEGTVYENGIKCDNWQISSKYNGWIDLFEWGTGNNPTKKSSIINFNGLVFVDWGNNVISNGKGTIWRTLTEDEWKYIFEERITKSGIRYVRARVNGILGTILLPDNWDNSIYNFRPHYSISQYDWTYIIEANGAIFLPHAGARDKSVVHHVNSYGLYWSSTFDDWCPSHVWLNYNDFTSPSSHMGELGQSVRLVCDVE